MRCLWFHAKTRLGMRLPCICGAPAVMPVHPLCAWYVPMEHVLKGGGGGAVVKPLFFAIV